MTPELSIITVSFNSEKTIERTIKSVLNQSYRNFEYIIVDGNSTDNTNKIIDRYKSRSDINITHISEPDSGIYDAMNKGISLAKGKLIGLLNSDDYYFDNTLSIVHKAYESSDLKSVITGELIFKSGNSEQLLRTSEKRFINKMNQYKNGVRHPATFVPKVIYDHIGLFNLDYKIASDAELIFRIFRAEYSFEFLDKPLLVMTDGGISNSKGIFQQLLFENRLFLKSYCPDPFLRYYLLIQTIVRLSVKALMADAVVIYRKIENK